MYCQGSYNYRNSLLVTQPKFSMNYSRYSWKVFKNLEWEKSGIQINGGFLNNLRFSDDIVLVSESTNEAQQMIMLMNRKVQKVVIKMKMKKTKVMIINYKRDHEIRIDDEVIECVQEYMYLG